MTTQIYYITSIRLTFLEALFLKEELRNAEAESKDQESGNQNRKINQQIKN